MNNENATVPALIPVLAVDDIQEAVAFYKALGFSELFPVPEQTGQLAHAHLCKGESVLFLGRLDVSHYESSERAETIKKSRADQRGIGITLILQVDSLAKIYTFVRSQQLSILAEPMDEFYGDRVFFFLDPFGYEWKISNSTIGE